MRQALLAPGTGSIPSTRNSQPAWIRLVGLCCQAAGGDVSVIINASAAWVALYTAAYLLDSVQDGDDPDPWWEPWEAGVALNVATGLIFTASFLIHSPLGHHIPPQLAQRVAQDFDQTLLLMCGGQHEDLASSAPSLADVWRIAEAKSGAFFSLACRTGATLAAIDDQRATHYSSFGCSLGLMIQIADDLRDLNQDARRAALSISRGRWSLPVAYFMQMASNQDLERMRSLATDPRSGGSGLQDLLNELGTQLYLMTKAEEQRTKALRSLQDAEACYPARAELEQLVNQASIVSS